MDELSNNEKVSMSGNNDIDREFISLAQAVLIIAEIKYPDFRSNPDAYRVKACQWLSQQWSLLEQQKFLVFKEPIYLYESLRTIKDTDERTKENVFRTLDILEKNCLRRTPQIFFNGANTIYYGFARLQFLSTLKEHGLEVSQDYINEARQFNAEENLSTPIQSVELASTNYMIENYTNILSSTFESSINEIQHFNSKKILSEQTESEILIGENEKLKQHIIELENSLMQIERSQNAIIEQEKTNKNSDLLLISALVKMLRNEKKIYTQTFITNKFEEENKDLTGLSSSSTTKIIAEANKLFKLLKEKNKQ